MPSQAAMRVVAGIATISLEVVAGKLEAAKTFGSQVLELAEDPCRREVNGSEAIVLHNGTFAIRFVDPLMPAVRRVSEYGIVFDVLDIEEVLARIAQWTEVWFPDEEPVIETSEPGVVEVFLPGLFHAPIGFKQVAA